MYLLTFIYVKSKFYHFLIFKIRDDNSYWWVVFVSSQSLSLSIIYICKPKSDRNNNRIKIHKPKYHQIIEQITRRVIHLSHLIINN